MKRVVAAIAFAGLLAFGAAGAGAAAPIPPHGEAVVTSRHQVRLEGGQVLRYAAHAGLLPLYVNDTGEKMGSMFVVAYMAERSPRALRRPITFLWNGGPGNNSAQVHVVGFGPKRPVTADAYPAWGPDVETVLADHPETWLEHSDLVFVDAIGTGFSRAASDAFREKLYTARGDAEAMAEVIRVFLNRFDAWDAPLFIAGESYGTTRAMLVADALTRRRTALAGVVLISGGYNAGQKVPPALTQALAVTEMTAAAHYHKRLPAELQALPEAEAVKAAEAWARAVYAPALTRREALTDAERSDVLAGLARFTGVEARFADPKSLLLSTATFSDRLLADRGLELGRYDARVTTAARPAGQPWLPTGDPSLERMADLMRGTSRLFNSYVRKDLSFETDLLYAGPFGGAFHPDPLKIDPVSGLAADWMSARFKFEAEKTGEDAPLRQAMLRRPGLEVLNLAGRYDGSCAGLDEARAETEPDLRRRVTNVCLGGGHMFYSDRDARRVAKQAFADFIRRAERSQAQSHSASPSR